MKKWWNRLLLGIVAVLLTCMPVKAADMEEVQSNMVLKTASEVKLREEPNVNANEVLTLETGTTVVVLEAEQNGWCMVSSQGKSGYVKLSELDTLENQQELDAEFDKISNTMQLAFDEIMTREKETRQARIWGTIIVILVVAIFGVGIVSAVRKNKEENEKENS